jgi:hypothetical protein
MTHVTRRDFSTRCAGALTPPLLLSGCSPGTGDPSSSQADPAENVPVGVAGRLFRAWCPHAGIARRLTAMRQSALADSDGTAPSASRADASTPGDQAERRQMQSVFDRVREDDA